VIPAPFRTAPMPVRQEWIDYNGHLNLAYYLVLFDTATDALWDQIGLGPELRTTGLTTFAVESHILYRAELVAGDSVVVDAQILGLDAKRLHVAHEMRRVADGAEAALQELMFLCVDLGTRRVKPWPDDLRAGLERAASAHAGLAAPSWVGRRVAMPSPAV
jgi:acyl-CoA thioester hydrolase